jgi:flagellar basal-body rod protein FlgB
MSNTIDPTSVLTRGLDALSMRQQVTANNVANAETPNFKASEVRFEDTLQQALAGQTTGGQLQLARTDARHLALNGASADMAPQVVQLSNTSVRNDGNNVDVEQQMTLLADTNLRYNAVSEALSRRFAMQRLLASDIK